MTEAAKGKVQPERRINAKVRRTYSQKSGEVTREWLILDASQTPLGRLATQAASLLIGKGKPTFTPHIDGGDYVIIINAANLKVTGSKESKKLYHNYSGYPSGLRTRKLADVPAKEAIYMAVRGMLPVNKLRDGRLQRLKIYDDDAHNHHAQKPKVFEMRSK